MPRLFVAEAENSTSIQLSWQRPTTPNGVIVHYTLVYQTTDGDPSPNQEPIPPTMTSFRVTGLNEYTDYTFTLTASTSLGAGPPAVATETTLEDGEN